MSHITNTNCEKTTTIKSSCNRKNVSGYVTSVDLMTTCSGSRSSTRSWAFMTVAFCNNKDETVSKKPTQTRAANFVWKFYGLWFLAGFSIRMCIDKDCLKYIYYRQWNIHQHASMFRGPINNRNVLWYFSCTLLWSSYVDSLWQEHESMFVTLWTDSTSWVWR